MITQPRRIRKSASTKPSRKYWQKWTAGKLRQPPIAHQTIRRTVQERNVQKNNLDLENGRDSGLCRIPVRFCGIWNSSIVDSGWVIRAGMSSLIGCETMMGGDVLLPSI